MRKKNNKSWHNGNISTITRNRGVKVTSMIKSGQWNHPPANWILQMNPFAKTCYKLVGELKDHTDSVQSLALTKNGWTMASGGEHIIGIYDYWKHWQQKAPMVFDFGISTHRPRYKPPLKITFDWAKSHAYFGYIAKIKTMRSFVMELPWDIQCFGVNCQVINALSTTNCVRKGV